MLVGCASVREYTPSAGSCQTPTVDGQRLLDGVAHRAPADPAAVQQLGERAGVELPRDYLDFLARSDGGEGEVGAGYLEVWPIARVLGQLEVEAHYEGVVLFAGDGGNTVFGFDRTRNGDVVEGDWIGLNRDEVIPRGPFLTFLEGLARGQE